MIRLIARVIRNIVEAILWLNLIFWIAIGYYNSEFFAQSISTWFLYPIEDLQWLIPFSMVIGFIFGMLINIIVGGILCIFLEIGTHLSQINSKLTQIKKDNKKIKELLHGNQSVTDE
tara:strand:+ start:193 stop:543 length:351 start_codon:yes stop_codon:yes gene_type:complete